MMLVFRDQDHGRAWVGGSKTLNVARSESDLEELAHHAARSPYL